MVMTADDLREHAENLERALNRKITDLWDCDDPARRTALLTQTRAIRARIAELTELIKNG
jgi:hypothetical protein